MCEVIKEAALKREQLPLLPLFLFHAALDVLQSPQAQPGGGAEKQRAERKLLFLHDIFLMCRFRVRLRLR